MTDIIEQVKVHLLEGARINFETLQGNMLLKGFTQEMVDFMRTELAVCRYRFYIGDDSGSMGKTDGQKFDGKRNEQCSRFQEMLQGLKEAFQICSRSGIESSFISLNNGSVEIKNGGNGNFINDDAAFAKEFYSEGGGTPLNKTLTALLSKIKLLPNTEKKKLVLYSDGEPSDGDITNVIKEIQSYNTSITIRLCTNEKNVVDYWERIDKVLEIRLDIIESYTEERDAIKKINKDLKYEWSIHRLRQFGLINNDFDRLDEAKLTRDQIARINALLGPEPVGCMCIIM